MDQDIFCFATLLTILCDVVLLVATGVGGCWWPIYASVFLMAITF